MHLGKEKNRLAVYKHFWSPILSSVSRCGILDFVNVFFCNGSLNNNLGCHDTTQNLVYLSILFGACGLVLGRSSSTMTTSTSPLVLNNGGCTILSLAERWYLWFMWMRPYCIDLHTSIPPPHFILMRAPSFCMWSILLSYINSNVPLHRNLGTRFFLRG